MAMLPNDLFRRTSSGGGILGTPARGFAEGSFNLDNPAAGHGVGQAFLAGGSPYSAADFADTLSRNLSGLDPEERARAIRERAAAFSAQEAANVTEETERRREEQLGLLNQEQERASKPTLSGEDVDRMFGKAADQASMDSEAMIRSLRQHLGMSGVRGGTAAGLGAQIELQRLGQISDSRRDLRIFKAQADAQDRLNRWMRAFQISNVMGQEPSPFLADQLNNITGMGLTLEGLASQERQAQLAADAQREAGDQAFLGSVIGGGFGLASAFI